MKMVLFGGTGFIGTTITEYFIKKDWHIILVSRSLQSSTTPLITHVCWDEIEQDSTQLEHTDVWINLAGESINSGRWTSARKQKILHSRTSTTQKIITLLSNLKHPPSLFLNGSAIGYYGTSLTETYTEGNKAGNDFLANTVIAWEQEAIKATSLGIRTCFLRFGVVLGKEGGALPRIALPYHAFIGGKIGHGQQWISWISQDEIPPLLEHLIHTPLLEGPINVVAPNPLTMNAFGKELASVLHRPHWLPVPSFLLRTLLGEMSILVLDGQKVLPQKLLQSGFVFRYPTLQQALQHIYKR